MRFNNQVGINSSKLRCGDCALKFFILIFLFLQTLTLPQWKGSQVSILGLLHTKICMYNLHTRTLALHKTSSKSILP
jgi:hypothetical protein